MRFFVSAFYGLAVALLAWMCLIGIVTTIMWLIS